MVTSASAIPPFSPEAEQRDHSLVVVQGLSLGHRVRVGSKKLTIGRMPDCDFFVADSEVSSHHCVVEASVKQTHVCVTDLQSTNGTFVEGVRVTEPTRLANGGLLRVGSQLFRYECRLQSEVHRAEELARDLAKATRYVLALLPAPIRNGPVRTDWFYLPSSQLGGDAFGYYQLNEDSFVGYLVDVSGHGVGAAMHAVSVMNVLRQRALPQTDFRDPAQVLQSLNSMFQMDSHDGQFFSIWYGVYNSTSRALRYASAGHHPSYLTSPQSKAVVPLQTRNLVIGAVPDCKFLSASVQVAPNSVLYVFSDGVFEVMTKDGVQWGLPEFLPLLVGPAGQDIGEAQRLYRAVQAAARPGPLDDDFSMLAVTFL